MNNPSSNKYVPGKTLSPRKLFGVAVPGISPSAEKPGTAALTNYLPFNNLCLDVGLPLSHVNLIETSPAQWAQAKGLGAVSVLKIQRLANGQVVFKLSGRIEADEVGELQELFGLETAGQELVLDLKDVTLVSQDAVTFLGGCEAKRIKLENCPAYIRAWIDRGKGRRNRRRK